MMTSPQCHVIIIKNAHDQKYESYTIIQHTMYVISQHTTYAAKCLQQVPASRCLPSGPTESPTELFCAPVTCGVWNNLCYAIHINQNKKNT